MKRSVKIEMDSTYSGSYGRIRAAQVEFLSDNFISSFYEMDIEGITRALSTRQYKEDIDQLYSLYRNPELLEMAINRRLAVRNRIALFAPPPNAADILRAYLAKWDVQNIKSVLTAKFLGYSLGQTEAFLVGFRQAALGIFAGNLRNEDYNLLLSLPDIEAIVEALSKYGYGATLLQEIERYRKENDISPMLRALDRYYYRRLFSSLRFYLGSEGPVIRYFREEVDLKNVMMLLIAKDLGIPFETIREEIIPNGNLQTEILGSIYDEGSVEAAMARFAERIGLKGPTGDGFVSSDFRSFEAHIRHRLYEKYASLLSAQAISIGSIFAFILRAERERELLLSIVKGKVYGVPEEKIKALAGGM